MIEIYILAAAVILGNFALAWSVTRPRMRGVSKYVRASEDASEASPSEIMPRIRQLELEIERVYDQLVRWNKKRGPDGDTPAGSKPAEAPPTLSRAELEHDVRRKAGIVR